MVGTDQKYVEKTFEKCELFRWWIINPTIKSNWSQWNSSCCSDWIQNKKPYLSYTIIVESSKISSYKLQKNTLSLYQKICELRFDENLTWKQVADSLNRLGYTSTRGGINTSSTVCSTYFKIRKYFERKHKYFQPDLDDVKLIWE